MKKIIIFDFNKTIYNPDKEDLYWGGYSLLKRLDKKFYLILVTTQIKNRIDKIQKLKITKYFNQIIIVKKKQLKFYKVLSKLGPAIIIGDNLKEEIRIGKKLRIKTILVNPSLENPILTVRKEIL